MTDSNDEKKPEVAPVLEVPEGKTLRAYQDYHPKVMCKCGAFLGIRIFDGMPPNGHDDNIRYQEILVIGVKKCEACAIVVPGIVTLN